MPRIKIHHEGKDGWSEVIAPTMERYRMACCHCGLVHDLEFQIVKVKEVLPDGSWTHGEPLDPTKYRVLFRAKRNKRSTTMPRKSKSFNAKIKIT
jgi:hypothetical protein